MKTILTGIIFYFLFIVGLCQNKQSNDSSVMKDTIIMNDTIPCQEISIKCTQSKSGNYIIRTEAEYHSILQIRSPHPDCESYNLPVIDFDKYTLIGVVTSCGGCGPPETEYMIVKTNPTNYLFKLKIKKIGFCKINFSVSVWCLIPKIENNAKVDFELPKI